ncbi:MAG: hypothetical protein FWG82_04105 [Oscillospiraceae bacterium]|nr:hypothetical protein [Oscillospiraceae bacterium]
MNNKTQQTNKNPENLNVHIAYGFHVNCYHSYRGDSNDELGFGGDIRIIRKIIRLLDDLNARGIPAKATWDFENAYSLEDILPKYAPDIIEGVKRRCKENGDENIIMGYNNGALSAMEPAEFDAAIQMAITNDKGSGLADIFGECQRIVRPQEVMFTPSQVTDYKRNGIDAVCLYYSCVPFDAFRTIVPQLKNGREYNPVRYTYKGESLTIMPTYSNADVMDYGCLRAWAKDLRRKQLCGEIDTDVLIFVNMDADAIFWEPLKLPFPLNKMANTQGILGLVEEVADLPYVVFDTVGGYLKNHETLAEITFGHDTADGSFTGYSSWSEKPFNRQIFTRVERARQLARVNGKSAGFDERNLLLSTTHFGLASPVLNIDRERRALALSQEMLEKELAARESVSKLTLVRPEPSALFTAQVTFKEGYLAKISWLKLEARELESFGALATSHHHDGSVASAFVICKTHSPLERLEINATLVPEITNSKEPVVCLNTKSWSVNFCEHGEITSVRKNGRQIGGRSFLKSAIRYNGKAVPFAHKKILPLSCAGDLTGLRISGAVNLSGAEKSGEFAYDFCTLPGVDAVFILSDIQYPYTTETHAFATHSSALGRKCDKRWQEAVPMQLTPMPGKNWSVVKRNFAGDISSFPLSSFRGSVPENTQLDSFNHQLTAGFVGLSDGDSGFLLCNARQVLGSMAHCPMRLRRRECKDVVSLNPMGTYYGEQRVHPSQSQGKLMAAYTIVTPQSNSLAPAYNGAKELGVFALIAFDGDLPEGDALKTACDFADGAVLLEPQNSPITSPDADKDNVSFGAITLDGIGADELKPVIVSGAMPQSPLRTAKVALGAFENILRQQIRAR